MKLPKFLRGVVAAPVATVATSFALSEAEKAVAALKTTDIGAAVASDIASYSDARLTGPEKFERVVVNTAPLIVKLLAKGGTNAAVGDVTDVARALVQSTFNDVQSAMAVTIASRVLSALKIA